MEGCLQEPPAQLVGKMDPAAWQNLYLNILVKLMNFCGFCGMEKTYNFFFFFRNGVLYIPLKSAWRSVVSQPLLVSLGGDPWTRVRFRSSFRTLNVHFLYATLQNFLEIDVLFILIYTEMESSSCCRKDIYLVLFF